MLILNPDKDINGEVTVNVPIHLAPASVKN